MKTSSNRKKNELNKNSFLVYLKSYLEASSEIDLYRAGEPGFNRKSFGWSLYMSPQENGLAIVMVEPRQKYDCTFEEFICLSENFGLLRISMKDAAVNQSFEIGCHQRLPESSQIRAYFNSLAACIGDDSELIKIKRSGLILLLSALFTELVFDATHLDAYLRDSKRLMMNKISSSVRTKMGTSFSAQDIVDDLGISVQYLNKVCRDFRGLTINNYLNFHKLEVFRSKLLYCKDGIAEMAESCGFQDVNYLIQLFKKTYFITPHQLRLKLLACSVDERAALNRTSGFESLSPLKRPASVRPLSVKDKRYTLIVANLSVEPLELYWLSPDGNEVPMTLIEGYERMHFGSAEGHYWMIRKADKISFYQIGSSNSLVCG